jgi:hypothetical protein
VLPGGLFASARRAEAWRPPLALPLPNLVTGVDDSVFVRALHVCPTKAISSAFKCLCPRTLTGLYKSSSSSDPDSSSARTRDAPFPRPLPVGAVML